MFRYWDGKAWSASVSPTPEAPPPPGAPAPTPNAGPQAAFGDGSSAGGGGSTSWPLWIGAGAAVLILVLVVSFAFRTIGGEGPRNRPGAAPSESVCPTGNTTPESPRAHPRDGRVHGGALSYPRLDAPWGPVRSDNRVPFGKDAYVQSVTTQETYAPGQSWQASIMVAELSAGDGFMIPEEASEVVVTCIVGAFYGENRVERNDAVSEAKSLDGHDGWYVESELSFDIKNLNTDGELLMVWIVRTSELTSSLYYASIPNDVRAEREPDARRVMEQLRVEN